MLYIINLFFGCWYLRWVRIDRWGDLWKFLPIIIMWTVIAGGQYYIGADYPMYFSYFNHYSGAPDSRFEWLFAAITDWTIKAGFYGQGPFFVFAFLNACILFAAGKTAKLQHWGIYYLLILTVAVIFNNQMNAVRQTTGVCLCFWAFLEFYERKWVGVILILIASGFHTSCLLCLVFVWIKPISDLGGKYPILLLVLSFGSAFIDNATQDFNNWLLSNMPAYFKENTHYGEAYEDSEYGHETSIIYRISKLLLIPLYWKSLMLVEKQLLTSRERNLFNLGFVSFFLRNILIVNTLTGRLSYYFWLPSIFPIYYLAVYYWQRKQWVNFFIVTAWCSATYFIKIAVGTMNYGTTFIYFR